MTEVAAPPPLVKYQIVFTQYLRPNGRRQETTIAVEPETAERAAMILSLGFVFEIEVLMNGMISMTIGDPKEEVDVAQEICANSPVVPVTVKKMVMEFKTPALQLLIDAKNIKATS